MNAFANLTKWVNASRFQRFEVHQIISLVPGILMILLLTGCGKNNRVSSPVLPGARADINAGNFRSLEEALEALPSEGGIVHLPPGEFKIDEPLVVSRSDVYLKGSGNSTHIINKNTSGAPAIQIQSKTSGDTSEAEALWRVHISDLRITGNEQSGEGILASDVNEIYIEGVTVSNNGGDGIKLDYCYENPRVVHSNITYNKGTGLNLVGSHDIVVNANQFEENNDALHCFDGYNLCMSGNNLDDHLNRGVVIENTYGSVLSGNMIEECQGAAIVLDRNCYGINLGSNVIAHNGEGILLRDAHGISVSANTFTINKRHAIFFGVQCGRITVSGNNFSNSYIGEGQIKRDTGDLAASGVTIDGGKNIAFSGNVFSGIQPDKAFQNEKQTNNIVFGNNLLIDSESDHTQLQNSMVIDNLVIPGDPD